MQFHAGTCFTSDHAHPRGVEGEAGSGIRQLTHSWPGLSTIGSIDEGGRGRGVTARLQKNVTTPAHSMGGRQVAGWVAGCSHSVQEERSSPSEG
jgi:hypothetical protein